MGGIAAPGPDGGIEPVCYGENRETGADQSREIKLLQEHARADGSREARAAEKPPPVTT